MTAKEEKYGTDARYGGAMIDPCLDLIRLWDEGCDRLTLLQRRLSDLASPQQTFSTTKHVVCELFAHRFLSESGIHWTRILKDFGDRLSRSSVEQICFLATVAADAMLRDFMVMEYWPRIQSGVQTLNPTAYEDFFTVAEQAGRGGSPWTDSRKKRLVSALRALINGFGLVQKSPGKLSVPQLRAPLINPDVTVFLVYALRERGYSPFDLVHAVEWQCFGLSPSAVVNLLRSSRFTEYFYIQSSGDLVDIAYQKGSLREAVQSYVA